MPSTFFVFGPDQSYFFNCPYGWKYNNIPKSLEDRLGAELGDDKRIRKLFCLGLGSGGEWAGSIKRYDGLNQLIYPNPAGHSGLRNWMRGEIHPSTGKPCVKPAPTSIHVTFGPTSAFFACDPSQGSRWEHPVSAEMDALVKKKAPPPEGVSWKQDAKKPRVNPVLTTLGIDQAFFILWPNGKFDYNLKGQYNELESILKGSAPGSISYLAMNPYVAGQYFITFHDRRVSYCMPPSWSANIQPDIIKWQGESEGLEISTTLSRGKTLSAEMRPANAAGITHEAPPPYSAPKTGFFQKLKRFFRLGSDRCGSHDVRIATGGPALADVKEHDVKESKSS